MKNNASAYSCVNGFAEAMHLVFLAMTFVCPLALMGQCNTLVWSDEFNDVSLNANNWSCVVGNGGFGNNELQYYTSNKSNVDVTGGNLVITAKNENNYLGSGSNYTSAKIQSKLKKSWKYGRFEARIKVPSASAIWPAFWMLPNTDDWPRAGEIDILETQNKAPKNASQTIHYFSTPPQNHQYLTNVHNLNVNWALDYHLYAVDWTPSQIVFSIDGVTTKTLSPQSMVNNGSLASDWTFDEQPFYMIFNVAVGGSYTGNALPSSVDYPVSMYVDFVRVYTNENSLTISGCNLLFTGETHTYSATDIGVNGTYLWVVPVGAVIESGQGTNSIVVKYNSALSGAITCSISRDACNSSLASYSVKAIHVDCPIVLDDYENNRNLSSTLASGVYSAPISNVNKNGSNSSAFCASYVRNGSNQWDILSFRNFLVGDPDDYRKGIRKFTMDVKTSAPAGTSVVLELGKTADLSKSFPLGRHSQYSAVTGLANTWTKLTFNWLASPDASLTGADVDKIQLLFNANTFTNHTYYIDNFNAEGTCLALEVNDSIAHSSLPLFFPNPFSDAFVLNSNYSNGETVFLNIFNVDGVLQSASEFKGNSTISAGGNLPEGMYIIQLQCGALKQYLKIVKVQR